MELRGQGLVQAVRSRGGGLANDAARRQVLDDVDYGFVSEWLAAKSFADHGTPPPPDTDYAWAPLRRQPAVRSTPAPAGAKPRPSRATIDPAPWLR